MKCRVLKITENDWDAICALVDLGLHDSVESTDGKKSDSAYYGDYLAWKKCEKRVSRQINEKRQQRQKRLTR